MDKTNIRALTSQLAEDLGWLEEHCRRRADHGPQAGQLRLAAAVVRNCLGPFLDEQPPAPLHIAVVGGAGAGKSTVANFLTGSTAAEANPQAGFTRHPIVYTSVNGVLSWPAHLGFLGPLRRLAQPAPANLDSDVYQVRRVNNEPGTFSLLQNFVVWDCPDMTTWAATGYLPRLMEIAGLADVIVYVSSDERYNDEVPTQFLQLLLQAGKPVVAVLMKMREADVPALLGHFHQEVLARLNGKVVASLAIPHLTAAQLADPIRQAGKYRVPLLNQVAVLGDPVLSARRRTVAWANYYLTAYQEQLLRPARQDLAALQGWRTLVQEGQLEFDHRYQSEFLTGEKFRRFDEALVRLLQLLELPGLGRVLSGALWVVRTPYRLIKGLFSKAMHRPDAPSMPELPVLEDALTGWLDMLRKEAARLADTHPLWAHIDKGFAGGLAETTRERFQAGLQQFHVGLVNEVDQTAREIYEELEKNPVALNTLRGTKLALEVGAITTTIVMGGLSVWDIIWVPLAASVTHHLVELLGKSYVENKREQARARQQALVTHYISGPLAEWLAQWPATGGSAFERLQLAVRRIPAAIQHLSVAVQGAIKG
jgi:hypothetical protein